MDVSVEEKSEFLIKIIKEDIYENSLVVIEWLGDIIGSSPVAAFKNRVCELENVYTPPRELVRAYTQV